LEDTWYVLALLVFKNVLRIRKMELRWDTIIMLVNTNAKLWYRVYMNFLYNLRKAQYK
jgi:hypothetical protein